MTDEDLAAIRWVGVARAGVNDERMALRHIHARDGIASASDGYRCRRAPVSSSEGYVDLNGHAVKCDAKFPDTTRLFPEERGSLTVRAAPLKRLCERLIGSDDFAPVGDHGLIPVVLLRPRDGEVDALAMKIMSPHTFDPDTAPKHGAIVPGQVCGKFAYAIDARLLRDALQGHKVARIAVGEAHGPITVKAEGKSLSVPEGAVEIIMGIAIPEEWAG